MRNNSLIVFDSDDIEIAWDIIQSWALETIKYVKFHSWSLMDRDIDIWEAVESVQEFTMKWIECYVWWWVIDSDLDFYSFKTTIENIKRLWIEIVEVTNSEWRLANPKKIEEVINILSWEFDKILIEVWTKDDYDKFSKDYDAWNRAIDNAVESGADEIVIEWWMWNVGIYTDENETKTLLLANILKRLKENGYQDKVIIEAWNKTLQSNIINLFWSDVTLWNIQPHNLWFVNYMRKQLISQKGLLEEFSELIDMLFKLCKKHKIDPNYFFFNNKFYDLNRNLQRHIKTIEEEVKSIIWERSNWIVVPSNPFLFLKTLLSNKSS